MFPCLKVVERSHSMLVWEDMYLLDSAGVYRPVRPHMVPGLLLHHGRHPGVVGGGVGVVGGGVGVQTTMTMGVGDCGNYMAYGVGNR